MGDAVGEKIERLGRVTKRRTTLPRWPLTWLLAGFPLWWVLGLGEFIWPISALAMAALLIAAPNARVPRGLAIWFVFFAWVVASLSQVDTFGRLAGALFRIGMYASAIVIFIYVFNARTKLDRRYVLGLLTVFFVWVIVGGYLGLAFPTYTLTTPLAHILPGGVLSNDLVHQMAVRRLTQYNPLAWNVIDPRPSAPFLYTNNWGNAYSILLPLVVLYLRRVRGSHRSRWLLALLPISLVPAFLTLNRGMFVGLGVVGVYVAVRFAVMGRVRALAGIAALSVLSLVVLQLLPVSDRLDSRLENSGTNASRVAVYEQTLRETLDSPLLGYGAPRPAEGVSIDIPALGTQGQVWMVVFSNGFVGIALFLAGILWLIGATGRHRDIEGIVFHAVLVAVLVESFFYGLLGAGLGIAMIVGALALRPEPEPEGAAP